MTDSRNPDTSPTADSGSALLSAAETRLLELVPDAVVIVDEHGTIRFANTEALTMFGYADLSGQPIETLVPEKLRQVHGAHTTRFLAQPSRRRMGDTPAELFGRRGDGSQFRVEISLSTMTSAGTNLVLATVRDISVRVAHDRDRLAIQQSLDNVRDAVLLFRADTRQIIHANAGAATQTGYHRPELLAMSPQQLLPDVLQADFAQLLDRLESGQESRVEIETRLRGRDGEDRVIELAVQLPPEAVLGGHQCFMAIAHDVTDRAAQQRLLAASEQSFRAAFENAPIPMFMADMTDPEVRTFLRVNQAAQRFFGYSDDELVGRSVNEFVRKDGHLPAEDMTAAAAQERYEREVPYLHRDGTTVWGALAARTIAAGDGTMTTRLSHVTDITRRVEAERERDRREAQLGLLADLRSRILQEENLDLVLAHLCGAGRELLGAAALTIAVPTMSGDLQIIASATENGQTPARSMVPIDQSFIGEVFASGSRQSRAAATAAGLSGLCVGEPLQASDGRIEGALVATPTNRTGPFTPPDIDLIAALALEAAVALELDRVRTDRRRLMVVEDRERIARDLHDVVIQRLFAAGMTLQSAIGTPRLDQRANDVVGDLDDTIRSVRDTIFRLTTAPASVTDELFEVAARYRSVEVDVEIDIEGDPTWITADRAEHLPPVLNELLSNAVRHGGASRIGVELVVDRDDRVTLKVVDDGRGLADTGANPPGLGTANLRERAQRLRGSFALSGGPVDGAVAVWSVPLRSADGAHDTDGVT